MAYLYVVLSRTTTATGKLIRTFTRCQYNHVSLALNEDLSDIVSFARYCIDTPFCAGFVPEPVERFIYHGEPVPIRVFQVEIPSEQAAQLQEFFSKAGDQNIGYLYNYFACFSSLIRLPCPVPGAYTCLSFVSTVMGKYYRTLQDLERDLAPYEIFCGNFADKYPDSGDRTDYYFTRRGFLRGTKDSFVHLSRLLVRVTRLRSFHDPIFRLQ